MMRTNLLIMIPPMLFLAASVPAQAAENELRMSMTTAVRYNDNIANVEQGKTDSFAFDLGPTFIVESSAAKYEAGASYSPRFTTYTDSGRRDNFTHNIGINGDYRPTEQWKLGLDDVLGIESDADRDFTSDNSDATSNGEKQTFRNFLNGTVTYKQSPRIQYSTRIGYNVTEREDKDLSDTSQVSGRVQGNYSITARDTIGTGALARRQVVQASGETGRAGPDGDEIGDTLSQYYGFFLYGEHRFTPLFSINASGGPTWLVSNRENDGRKQKTSLDYFAYVELSAEIDRGSLSMTYQRSSSDFARTATAFTIDEVSANIDYAVTSLLIVGVSGEWNQRKAVLKIQQGNFVNKVDQWRAAATASYRISPSLSTQLTFDYLRQESDDAPSSADKTDRYRVTVRFNYHAKPFRF